MGLRSYPKIYFELLFSAFTLIMGMSLSSAFLPLFANELDPSGVLVGLVVSAWSFSRIFTELPSGILADQFGGRNLLVGGLALSAAGALLCSIADSVYLLIVGRTLWGLGTALFFLSSSAMIFDLFKSRTRGRALGTFQGIEFIGSFIGAPIGAYMVGVVGYKGVFLLAFVLMLCSFFAAFLSKGLQQSGTRNAQGTRLSFTELLTSLRSWGLTVVCINSFSRMLIWNGLIGTFFPLYLNLELGIEVELIGLIVSMRTIGVIIATVSSGYLSDIFGRKLMIVSGLLLQSCCFYVYAFIFSFEMLLLVGIFEGFGRGMTLTSMMVLLSEIVPSRLRGGAIGVYRTFMDIGGFLGPLLFMILFGRLGSDFTLFSAIVILLINLGLVVTIKSKKPTDMK